MKKTLLLVFIHGFKGSDTTFNAFPKDLSALLSHALPQLQILSVQYPQYETRGDLAACVAKFSDWLQEKVIDLEVENGTPSPTVDPSVRVVLVGHSMGGIVAAETLLRIANDQVVAPGSYASDTTNLSPPSTGNQKPTKSTTSTLAPDARSERASSAPPSQEPTRLFFPFIQAILAFDTPYLGISPGVLAHGAEERINQASAAYKAFDSASQFFGWNASSASAPTAPQPIPNAANRALPAPGANSTNWGAIGKYAMYGGAAAAIAGAAGAAYLNWQQINEGLVWAGSHLEFVGCLARGAELQSRVENVVALTKSHGVGFADFYACLDEKVSRKTQYAGAVLGQDRTFCVVAKSATSGTGAAGTKRNVPSSKLKEPTASKRRKTEEEKGLEQEMKNGEAVAQYAQDASKSKGDWVKCVNAAATDELKAHTSLFNPVKNPDYHAMVPRARDWIVEVVDRGWAESADGREEGKKEVVEYVDLSEADPGAEGKVK